MNSFIQFDKRNELIDLINELIDLINELMYLFNFWRAGGRREPAGGCSPPWHGLVPRGALRPRRTHNTHNIIIYTYI